MVEVVEWSGVVEVWFVILYGRLRVSSCSGLIRHSLPTRVQSRAHLCGRPAAPCPCGPEWVGGGRMVGV